MTLLLRIRDPQFFRKRSTGAPVRTINLDVDPCPTIMADGIRSVGRDKYWLEATDQEMIAYLDSSQGKAS